MRIQVRRTGGFAGIERYAQLDTAGRPDAAEWHALAQQAVACARTVRPVGVPDGFSYEITVDGKTVYAADPQLTEEQRTLISRVLKEGA
ncbi:protealysin inhibitor emfourin [Streptomyces acidiscabies]|uniref:Metalloprotease n=1 Tax=Streptomyces acidiscabies TaxID=42234 RepID=A0A0L0JVU2_9ACTN|nr:protealysin inhibitor emfourin [Streptomyces acidiscabies]KND29638.1 metalloprotease [Streptomyces acidiscabies]